MKWWVILLLGLLALGLTGWLLQVLGVVNYPALLVEYIETWPPTAEYVLTYRLGEEGSQHLREAEEILQQQWVELEKAQGDLKKEASRLAAREQELQREASRLAQWEDTLQRERNKQVSEELDRRGKEELALIYEGLRPEQASQILRELPRSEMAVILSYMDPTAVARIFAVIPAKEVAELNPLLAQELGRRAQ